MVFFPSFSFRFLFSSFVFPLYWFQCTNLIFMFAGTRSDSSGTTSIFTRALQKFNSTIFDSYLGQPGKVVNWTNNLNYNTEVSGSDDVIDCVKNTKNSISYVSFDYVKRQDGSIRCLAIASSRNSSSSNCLDIVEPTAKSVTRSIEIASESLFSSNDYKTGIDLMGENVLSDPKAWPISSFTYIAVRNLGRQRRTLYFFFFFLKIQIPNHTQRIKIHFI